MSKLHTLLRDAVKRSGTYDPDETLFLIEEMLTLEEYRNAKAFLRWCVENNRTFGWNIAEVYEEWGTSTHEHPCSLR